MVDPECLNPKDVLTHLNSLGYHDIHPQQLREFLHDLKKLIKYEQKQALRECVETQVANILTECRCTCLACGDRLDKLSSNESYCESSTCVSSSSSCGTYNFNDSECTEFKKSCVRNSIDSDQAATAHTSFIRPWNLKGYRYYSSRGKKSMDPVRLYHKYKEFWKNQNIPGESKHSELRWIIRHKMIGQKPHPGVFITNPKYFS